MGTQQVLVRGIDTLKISAGLSKVLNTSMDLGRLELCINTCTQLHEQMQSSCAQSIHLNDDEREISGEYQENLVCLVESLKCIHTKWQD